ncbi:MAG: hypothetical protein QNJ48_07430 [Desulfobacterales bacterium]|nr:hypothetical protein [Desulfobacterales bacterium]MDJ0875124.1 hypothetical protein [Desulfobacterales bacterium]MDJ0883975.1 hypothetical protein [Desulfobacterales bacterium]
MNHHATTPQDLDRFLGCFGSFNAENSVCLKHCSLNLRCAIEKDEHMRMELLEDLISSDGVNQKMQ